MRYDALSSDPRGHSAARSAALFGLKLATNQAARLSHALFAPHFVELENQFRIVVGGS